MQKPFKILLVEDEKFIAMLMEMELEEAGFTVCRQVATGESAVEAAEEENPHAILMDIRLAGELDGVDASMKIRAFSQVPIIFMTGYQDESTRERAKAVDPLAYLIKPVDIQELIGLLNSIV